MNTPEELEFVGVEEALSNLLNISESSKRLLAYISDENTEAAIEEINHQRKLWVNHDGYGMPLNRVFVEKAESLGLDEVVLQLYIVCG